MYFDVLILMVHESEIHLLIDSTDIKMFYDGWFTLNNMKTIYLNGEVNYDMMNTVIQALNEEWEITFYLESEWWRTQCAYTIIDAINRNKDRVTLIATLQIASAAFRIFFYSECKRHILNDTEWLAHMGTQSVRMNWNKDISSTDRWRIEEMMKQEYKEEKFLKKLWVSKRNRELFLKWYDIYFTTKKLRKMLIKSIW